jgi:thymidylate synthase
MTSEIFGNTANEMWLGALHNIMQQGSIVKPRGMECLEVLGMRVSCPMRKPIVTNAARGLGYKFMFAEAHWILTGDNRVETITPFSKKISEFSDDGLTFYGAYGPRIEAQAYHIIHTLSRDRDSRQAVLTIWIPSPRLSKDIPCTISAQFLIRDNQLHCIDTMRSSDIWLGLPYDTFNFSMLSCYILLWLNKLNGWNLTLGNLYLSAGSMHLYRDNMLTAAGCLSSREAHKFRYAHLDPMVEFQGNKETLIRHLFNVSRGLHSQLESQWVCCVARGDHDKKEKTDAK